METLQELTFKYIKYAWPWPVSESQSSDLVLRRPPRHPGLLADPRPPLPAPVCDPLSLRNLGQGHPKASHPAFPDVNLHPRVHPHTPYVVRAGTEAVGSPVPPQQPPSVKTAAYRHLPPVSVTQSECSESGVDVN